MRDQQEPAASQACPLVMRTCMCAKGFVTGRRSYCILSNFCQSHVIVRCHVVMTERLLNRHHIPIFVRPFISLAR